MGRSSNGRAGDGRRSLEAPVEKACGESCGAVQHSGKLRVAKSEKSAIIRCRAGVAELVDALDLGSSVFGREGSSPFTRIFHGVDIFSPMIV